LDPPLRAARTATPRELTLAMGVVLLAYAGLVLRFDFLCDDAYISFRYARHLAQAGGLRFNPGENPPVEGYSNLLWVLWLTPVEWLGLDVGLAARATSVTCGAVLLALALRLAARRLELGAGAILATALFLATLPPFAMWATGGLETMAFAFCLFAVFERLALEPARPRPGLAAPAALAAVLLRTDGVLWVALALAAAWLGAPRAARRPVLRGVLIAGGLAAAGVAAQAAFRVGYHHDWIPNTARVKAGLSWMRLERGAKYLASLLLELPALALVPLASLLWARGRSWLGLQALVVVLGAAAYAVFIGGDFMAMGRFVVPALPFVALCLASVAAGLERRPAALLALASLVLISSLLCASDRAPVQQSLRQALHFRWNEALALSEVEQWRRMRDRAREWAAVGRELALHTRPGESIILPNLGAIAYPTELFAHDPFGLVSPQVARRRTPARRASPGHDKGVELSFFFDRRPDYLGAWIAPAGSPLDAGLPAGFADSQLGRRTRLERFPVSDGSSAQPRELRVLRLVFDG